jgi:hypothetical protein
METTYFDPARLYSSQYSKTHGYLPLPRALKRQSIWIDGLGGGSKEMMAENGGVTGENERQDAFEQGLFEF